MKRAWLLLVLLLLASTSFWWKQRMQKTASPDKATSFEYQIEGLKLLSTNARGEAELELQARSLQKATDQPLLQLADPVIRLNDQTTKKATTEKGGWFWSIRAVEGWLHSDSQVVDLRQDVQVAQLKTEKPLRIHGESLRYHPAKRLATSESVITMTQGSLKLTATGMRADFQAQTIQLNQAVQGSFHVP